LFQTIDGCVGIQSYTEVDSMRYRSQSACIVVHRCGPISKVPQASVLIAFIPFLPQKPCTLDFNSPQQNGRPLSATRAFDPSSRSKSKQGSANTTKGTCISKPRTAIDLVTRLNNVEGLGLEDRPQNPPKTIHGKRHLSRKQRKEINISASPR
jgi:hypothetical protein